jgi:hypothetical protein
MVAIIIEVGLTCIYVSDCCVMSRKQFFGYIKLLFDEL